MKKALFLFFTAACLFQLESIAQKNTRVGITGGVSVTNIYGDVMGQNTRGDARAGITVGMIMDVPIRKSTISFQPGVHYVQKGRFTKKTESVREAEALRYADFVFNFVKYTGNPDGTSLYFGLGPQVGLNLPSKRIRVEDGTRTELSSISFGKTSANDYRGIDWGANGLMGIRFKCGVTFAVNYTFGFRNLIPTEILDLPGRGDDNLRNGALGIRLGYLFPATPKEREKKSKK